MNVAHENLHRSFRGACEPGIRQRFRSRYLDSGSALPRVPE
jgi:hypothetical protein